ncbi:MULTISPECIES: GntR family transcriptional regulator [Rathayibacter]|uniref:GntR family transcriptional regulator n=1 Tax=Rathayibacter TaxID=33886 RepID=UPI000F4BC310|nr:MULTISPECIES: GntR family transcriptional regulator [Rathayibacter]MDY0913732.1 GntR family transcriptional regulator [Rathayibacter festucae]ROP44371.1 GntR family transcriptional regulator [Rathayibacter sp. PhB186]ROS46961.1 GntR family transcriptional regulator [Rathayibacter sp. PhB185]
MAQIIERASPVPYYEQLFSILKRRITAGEIPTDERLPSELELGREFGLSRATVRQTLTKLENEGFARRVARRGVFAAAPEKTSGWTVQDTQGFLDSQLRHGRTGITTEVVDARFLVPPEHAAEALQIDAGTPVFALERVRSLDGTLAMFSTNWFPDEVARTISSADDVLDGTGSVDSTLRRAGFTTSGAHRVIRSMRAPQHVASHLRIGADDPVLRVRSWSWDQNEFRFDYYETWVLTDVVPLEVMVSAS